SEARDNTINRSSTWIVIRQRKRAEYSTRSVSEENNHESIGFIAMRPRCGRSHLSIGCIPAGIPLRIIQVPVMSRVCSNTPRVETRTTSAPTGDTPRRQNGDERNVRDVVAVQVPIISSWHVVSGRYTLERGTSGLAIGSPFPGGRGTTDGEPIATNGKKVKQSITLRCCVARHGAQGVSLNDRSTTTSSITKLDT
ncbi:unnamed protein product, partial [Heterotrigona itama]